MQNIKNEISSSFLEDAIQSNAWPFLEAKKILDKIKKKPNKGFVLFETGYGPSGLPHIGTFAEVARSVMVQKAFEQISSIPTKLICFSDDMDGLRKIPDNIPNPEMLFQHLGKPLTSIPDPFKKYSSYGEYMNQKLCSFLTQFNFEYTFLSSTKCYKSGLFDKMMLQVLKKYDEIMALMLPTLRSERKKTYSPFMPICPSTGVVLQVPIIERNVKRGTIKYLDSGKNIELPVTQGNCKLQWKPDFAMRWAALEVDYEMYGKDHRPNARIYSEICKILNGEEPVQFFYELFLDEKGEKISKSKGNSISVEEWLQYAPMESMLLFMYYNPTRAKKLFFDTIPKSVDEYIILNKRYHDEISQKQRIANPLYHIHGAQVPKIETFGISFSLLLNLISVCNASNKNMIWEFILKNNNSITKEKAWYLEYLMDFAIKYYKDYVQPTKSYLLPNTQQNIILKEILELLKTFDSNIDAEEIQKQMYTIGTKYQYQNLREFFIMIYQILLGQKDGPRLGTFIKIFGINNTISLIQEKILEEI